MYACIQFNTHVHVFVYMQDMCLFVIARLREIRPGQGELLRGSVS